MCGCVRGCGPLRVPEVLPSSIADDIAADLAELGPAADRMVGPTLVLNELALREKLTEGLHHELLKILLRRVVDCLRKVEALAQEKEPDREAIREQLAICLTVACTLLRLAEMSNARIDQAMVDLRHEGIVV